RFGRWSMSASASWGSTRSSPAPSTASGAGCSAGARASRVATVARRRSPSRFGLAARYCRVLGDRADVLHQLQCVPLTPGLDDLSVLEAVDSDPMDRGSLLTGRLQSHQRVLERSLSGPA